ncbi:uncharacterized protein [Asterias amurensis]|uniref:uncharacterized protein n=1 Tax=Asterias amurensis TaxID=7602 RepID=UPI003AB556DA
MKEKFWRTSQKTSVLGVKDLNIDIEKLPTERALSMMWSIEEDEFGFRIQMKDKPPTRRGILSIDWTKKIPANLEEKWQTWQTEMPKLAEFKMDRCMKPEGFEDERLKLVTAHHFADASESGYGSVSYLRLENDVGEVKCSFLMSKSRLALFKQVTIPRMELTAATVAVRVDHMIKRELAIEVDDTYFWTDSTSVLWYINSGTTRFKTFFCS